MEKTPLAIANAIMEFLQNHPEEKTVYFRCSSREEAVRIRTQLKYSPYKGSVKQLYDIKENKPDDFYVEVTRRK